MPNLKKPLIKIKKLIDVGVYAQIPLQLEDMM